MECCHVIQGVWSSRGFLHLLHGLLLVSKDRIGLLLSKMNCHFVLYSHLWTFVKWAVWVGQDVTWALPHNSTPPQARAAQVWPLCQVTRQEKAQTCKTALTKTLLPRSKNDPELHKIYTWCMNVLNARHPRTCSLARMCCDWAGSLTSGRLSAHPGSTSLLF